MTSRSKYVTLRTRVTAFHLLPSVYRSRTVLLLWAGLLLLVGAGEVLPWNSLPMELLSGSHLSDKVMHFSAYAVLALVPAVGFQFSAALPCLIATELVGVGLEFSQLLVPGRSCDVYDVAANTVGVLAGAALAIVIRSRIVRAPV